MSKLRKSHNKKLILVLPIILVVSFGVLLTYSFANFKSIKLFDAVGGFFLGNEYTLSYDVANCTSKIIKNGKTFGELCEPATPDGYTFDGWYYNDELIESTTQVHTNQNVQLLAHFTQTFTCNVGDVYNFDYTGDVQNFIVKCPGKYKVELWGAQGGFTNDVTQDRGGYVRGNIYLNNTDTLYIYTGGAGSTGASDTPVILPGGYNGGGIAFVGQANLNRNYSSGGGATDIRLTGGDWNNFDSLKSRIMVAGGGGGSYKSGSDNIHGGAGGGLSGYDGANSSHSTSGYGTHGTGGTQTTFGVNNCDEYTCRNILSYSNTGLGYADFGLGGGHNGGPDKVYSCGGGSGYYGGGSSTHGQPGGGGSSFISGYGGCNAIAESSTSSSIIHTGQPNHYSGKVFFDSIMIDGKGCNWSTGSAANCGANQPQPDGTYAVGHSGNGYARITYLGNVTEFAYTGNYQTFNAPFDGSYQVELWGGSGNGVNAGYTKGIINLDAGEQLYVFVGTQKNSTAGAKTFNAGTGNDGGHEGGGATDVRYFSSTPTTAELTWDNFSSLKARIMVAGGGGSGSTAGAGGGLTGYNGKGTAGGTQITAGARERSQYTNSTFGVANGGCSGGNGYYPGGGALCADGAGGGSSFISGYPGCNAISSTSTSSSIVHTGQPNHYSGKVFTNSVMIDGKGCDWSTGSATNCGANQPQPDGTTTAGHSGAGYAKITYLGVPVTVTFNALDGNVNESTRPVAKNWQIGVLPIPTRDNYTFAGWYLDSEYTTEVDSSYVVTKNITLYAKWIDGIQLVPVMTNNTSPSGRANSTNDNSQAYLYFDGNDTTCFDVGKTVTGSNEAFISYEFPSAVLVKRLVVKNHITSDRASYLLRFEASTNNSSWVTLVNLNGTPNDVDVTIQNDTRYRYYRLIIRGTTSMGPGICSMQLYGSK